MIDGPLDSANRPCLKCEHPECSEKGSMKDWGKNHSCYTKEKFEGSLKTKTDDDYLEEYRKALGSFKPGFW